MGPSASPSEYRIVTTYTEDTLSACETRSQSILNTENAVLSPKSWQDAKAIPTELRYSLFGGLARLQGKQSLNPTAIIHQLAR